jgi:amidase
MKLAPSYDTIGWLARDPAVMSGIAHVLFDTWREPEILTHLLVPEDVWTLADKPVQTALLPALERLEQLVAPHESVELGDGSLEPFYRAYVILQGREAWQTHKDWIETVKPKFSPGIAERFKLIAAIEDGEVAKWRAFREALTAKMNAMLTEGVVMALPTAPCIAPKRGLPQSDLADARKRILQITAAASHAGLPQLSLPVATVDGCPVGLSIIARPGGDEILLDLARRL